MKAWKYVHPDHAPGALQGVFRLGTPQDYKDLEDQQADELDSARRRRITRIRVTDSDAPEQHHERSTLRSMGIQLEGCTGDIVFENFNVTQRVPGHALCLCREPNSGSFGEKTAVIEIADVEQLALYLTLNNAELGRRPLVREVSYGEVDVEANPYNAGSASPFLKGVSFQRENELRIFWPSQRAQPFISKPMVLPDGLVSWVNA